MGTKFSFIKKLWHPLKSGIIFWGSLLSIIVFIILFHKVLFNLLKSIINFFETIFCPLINFIIKIHDLIFLFLILLIIAWIFILNKKFKTQFKDISNKFREIERGIRKFEVSPTEKTIEFKEMIRKAVKNADFRSSSGLYSNIEDPEERIRYKIITKKREPYIIVGHYREGILFPSEQVETYFDEAEKSDVPIIVAIIASDLTPEAKRRLEDFNVKFDKPRLSFICGSYLNEFIKKFSDL